VFSTVAHLCLYSAFINNFHSVVDISSAASAVGVSAVEAEHGHLVLLLSFSKQKPQIVYRHHG